MCCLEHPQAVQRWDSQKKTLICMLTIMVCLPATEKGLMDIQKHQETDPILQQLKEILCGGVARLILHWPSFSALLVIFGGELSVQNGLLLNGIRIVIPASLRAEIFCKLHEGHLGITKCRKRAKQSVFGGRVSVKSWQKLLILVTHVLVREWTIEKPCYLWNLHLGHSLQ